MRAWQIGRGGERGTKKNERALARFLRPISRRRRGHGGDQETQTLDGERLRTVSRKDRAQPQRDMHFERLDRVVPAARDLPQRVGAKPQAFAHRRDRRGVRRGHQHQMAQKRRGGDQLLRFAPPEYGDTSSIARFLGRGARSPHRLAGAPGARGRRALLSPAAGQQKSRQFLAM